ncbi:MAG TPA: hypothetical protein VFZ65_15260 [Planctomycetota bacterium]|nr:hypothetical protein [Planctomycetota bacterium]
MPCVLAAATFTAVLSLDSRGMLGIAAIWLAAWVLAHEPRWRVHWSDLGHRIALATAGGSLGLCLGLVCVQHRTLSGGEEDLLTAGWPFLVVVGRVRSASAQPSIIGGHEPPGYSGPYIEGAGTCAVDFVFWFLTSLLLASIVPRARLAQVTRIARYYPPVVLLTTWFLGPVVVCGS